MTESSKPTVPSPAATGKDAHASAGFTGMGNRVLAEYLAKCRQQSDIEPGEAR